MSTADEIIPADRAAAFLADLTALTIRYRIGIGGCGCCGSPFLFAVKPDEIGKRYRCDSSGQERGDFDKLAFEPE